jgi:hypothetical protein
MLAPQRSPMLRPILVSLFAVLLATVNSTTAPAHHTFVVKYDPAKLVTISGTITSVSYANPHIRFDVSTGSTTWTVETESISVAKARGITPAVLKEGAKVTVTGWRARDGSAEMGLNRISIAGGPSATLRRTAR